VTGPGPDDPVEPVVDRLNRRRFTRAERWVHRSVAALLIGCVLTGAVLYNGSLALAVGHRRIVELIHVWCGFALPVPLVIGLASAGYRADLGRLNRWTQRDRQWLRSRRHRRERVGVGKFNAGQKLNSWLSFGAILVLLMSGTVMYVVDLLPLRARTGATFVHDWVALAIGLLVLGHIYRATRDPEARRGMRTGVVSATWAAQEHPDWPPE
jgi:formate dehydrogenase subunit gamma